MIDADKIDSNYLLNEIDRLKNVIIDPKKHIRDYFNNMKNEIDSEYQNALSNLTNADVVSISKSKSDICNNINTSWIDIINEIDEFKNECLNKNDSFQLCLNQYSEKINKIEDRIRSKNILQIITPNQVYFKRIKKSIDEQNYNIYKYLFNNKTIIYINRNKCNEYETLNDCKSIEPIDFQDLIGRLIIIQDYYLNDFDYINLFLRKIKSFEFDHLKFIHSLKKIFDIDILKSQILNDQLITYFKTKIINKLILTNIEKIDFSPQNLLNNWPFEIKTYLWEIKRSDLFNDFKSLKSLDLSFYNLDELPSKIFDNLGSTLLKLELNIRSVFSLFDANIFSKLKNLTELNLVVKNKSNHLKIKLPFKLFNNIGPSLKLLKISIRGIDNNDLSLFYDLINIEELNLMFLPISKLSTNDFNTMGMKLKKLYLYSNEIECLDSKVFCKLKNLRELDLSSNHIKLLYDGVFNDLKNLEILSLFNNGLKFLHKNIFKTLTNLKMIDLSKNKIEQLDSEIFQNNVKLKIILLECNMLRKINENLFINLNELRLLTLSHNKFDFLNNNCLKDLQLEVISISNNNFQYFCNEYKKTQTYHSANFIPNRNSGYIIYDSIHFEIVNHYKKFL